MHERDLQRLAQRAREERVEGVDVRGRVLAELARARRPAPPDRALLAFAAASLAAAAAMAIFALPVFQALEEPLAGLFAGVGIGPR
ncbi:MAG TPA: hypothetical protein VFY71_13345 [Planctomycetota bacterium]|nr:hypothetical protein [Planctomycetota bacterium]